jgi:hypothetical protein
MGLTQTVDNPFPREGFSEAVDSEVFRSKMNTQTQAVNLNDPVGGKAEYRD